MLVDDVMFSYNGANGPESKATRMFRRRSPGGGTDLTSVKVVFGRVRQVAAPAAKSLPTIAWLFLFRNAPLFALCAVMGALQICCCCSS